MDEKKIRRLIKIRQEKRVLEEACTFMTISRSILLKMGNVSGKKKIVGKIKTRKSYSINLYVSFRASQVYNIRRTNKMQLWAVQFFY